MKIFAFIGPARCGKTTASDILEKECNEYGYHVERLSFAAPIKKGCERVGVTKEANHDEYRELAQRWGKGRRERNPNHYVDKAARTLDRLARTEHQDYLKLMDDELVDCWDETVVIVDDVRYPNEVELLSKRGATLVLVDPGSRLDLSEEWRQHESETMANELIKDERLAEEFLETHNGWWLTSDKGVEKMEQLISIYCEALWFNGVWSVIEE